MKKKAKHTSLTGKITWFRKHLGYGFIQVDGRKFPDAFFHYSQLKLPEGQYKTIKRNTRVRFTYLLTRLGPLAKDVELL